MHVFIRPSSFRSAGLNYTNFAYNCRLRLSKAFKTCFKRLQLFSCCIELSYRVVGLIYIVQSKFLNTLTGYFGGAIFKWYIYIDICVFKLIYSHEMEQKYHRTPIFSCMFASALIVYSAECKNCSRYLQIVNLLSATEIALYLLLKSATKRNFEIHIAP